MACLLYIQALELKQVNNGESNITDEYDFIETIYNQMTLIEEEN